MKYGTTGFTDIAPTGDQKVRFHESEGACSVYKFGNQVTTLTANQTLTSDHAGIVVVNKADGAALTLPDATGSGLRYQIIIGTTVTSNSTTIKVPDADNVMTGVAIVAADGGSTVVGWETAATTDTITFDGSTTGGIKGDCVELIDIAADLWYVRVTGSATGTEATPFSATVS